MTMKKEVLIEDIKNGAYEIEHIRTFQDIDFVWSQDQQQLRNAATGAEVPLEDVYDQIRSCLNHKEELVCKRKKKSHRLLTMRLEKIEDHAAPQKSPRKTSS